MVVVCGTVENLSEVKEGLAGPGIAEGRSVDFCCCVSVPAVFMFFYSCLEFPICLSNVGHRLAIHCKGALYAVYYVGILLLR